MSLTLTLTFRSSDLFLVGLRPHCLTDSYFTTVTKKTGDISTRGNIARYTTVYICIIDVCVCVCALCSLSSVLDGLRHNADSYSDQQYYSHVIYEWVETDGRARLARFRAVPADGRRETGRLIPDEYKQVWNYLLVITFLFLPHKDCLLAYLFENCERYL